LAAIPGVVFSGSADGHIRAYSAGRVVWDFDTWREFETVNGVPGRGGSLDGPPPAIAGGLVYVNSGSAIVGQPGNVLVVFGP
jgi:polyvinyl alcohol dehydrogenase (cytochrome)